MARAAQMNLSQSGKGEAASHAVCAAKRRTPKPMVPRRMGLFQTRVMGSAGVAEGRA